ncbi:MAG TPA: hypothetical protein VJ302_01690 [Blastocatellia bacterium]|nr:hypothetical protein [Blastocatellia bacterium]
MRIAKIIKSNSHVDYAARVLDSLEISRPPSTADYHFGQFVKIPAKDREGQKRGEAIGVIYNSQLINPEYGNYGPRLSTPPEINAVFSPDYLNEQGVLIGILLLGWRSDGGRQQGVPREVLPINSDVETMASDEVRAFHHDESGALQFHYFSHITTHAGPFAFQLLSAIVDQLDVLTTERERSRLNVLRRSLAWQQTVGKMR